MTKLASKVDGGDAENKFSGSDQSLDALIAAMEEAQVLRSARIQHVRKEALIRRDPEETLRR